MVRNLAMTTDLDEIGNTVVTYENDRPIRLRDVASLVWDIEPMRGDAGLGTKHIKQDGAVKGYPGVILSVTKSPGFDTIDLTERVEAALTALQQTLPAGVEVITLYRQSDFINLSIGNLEEALRDGAIMVGLVLFLFLFNVRITLITLTAIPLSLGITILVFDLMDLSVNSMTLGGLAVAIGMVVDDAIVDVENVFRRLCENASLSKPRPRLEVIASASAEVRSSILYATVLIILVFLPLLALSGVEGRLFSPIAIATIVSMSRVVRGVVDCDPGAVLVSIKSEGGQSAYRRIRRAWFEVGLSQDMAQLFAVAAVSRVTDYWGAAVCRVWIADFNGGQLFASVSRADCIDRNDDCTRYIAEANHRTLRYCAGLTACKFQKSKLWVIVSAVPSVVTMWCQCRRLSLMSNLPKRLIGIVRKCWKKYASRCAPSQAHSVR